LHRHQRADELILLFGQPHHAMNLPEDFLPE
jgi:hypothetical protein